GRGGAGAGGVTAAVPARRPRSSFGREVRLHDLDATLTPTRGGRTMEARIDSPALTVPGALQALHAIADALKEAGIPETTLYLVELRASQINGCGVCVDIHSRELELAGEPAARINTVAAWRDVSYFTEAE